MKCYSWSLIGMSLLRWFAVSGWLTVWGILTILNKLLLRNLNNGDLNLLNILALSLWESKIQEMTANTRNDICWGTLNTDFELYTYTDSTFWSAPNAHSLLYMLAYSTLELFRILWHTLMKKTKCHFRYQLPIVRGAAFTRFSSPSSSKQIPKSHYYSYHGR